jgi:hypothetical protein
MSPMSDAKHKLGKRVRFLPGFYITRRIPQANCGGEIAMIRQSRVGEPTRYTVLLESEFQSGEKEVDALEEEIEELGYRHQR